MLRILFSVHTLNKRPNLATFLADFYLPITAGQLPGCISASFLAEYVLPSTLMVSEGSTAEDAALPLAAEGMAVNLYKQKKPLFFLPVW